MPSQQDRARLRATRPTCKCGRPATTKRHHPNLEAHTRPHVEGSPCCALLPSCGRCALAAGEPITFDADTRGYLLT